MTDNIRLKICGLTNVEDAEFAAKSGADYLGFIQHPESPSYIPLEKFSSFASRLPKGRRVGVVVEPSLDQLTAMKVAGSRVSAAAPVIGATRAGAAAALATGAGLCAARLGAAPALEAARAAAIRRAVRKLMANG